MVTSGVSALSGRPAAWVSAWRSCSTTDVSMLLSTKPVCILRRLLLGIFDSKPMPISRW